MEYGVWSKEYGVWFIKHALSRIENRVQSIEGTLYSIQNKENEDMSVKDMSNRGEREATLTRERRVWIAECTVQNVKY